MCRVPFILVRVIGKQLVHKRKLPVNVAGDHVGEDVDDVDGDVADADVTIILINSTRTIHMYMHNIINICLNIMCISSILSYSLVVLFKRLYILWQEVLRAHGDVLEAPVVGPLAQAATKIQEALRDTLVLSSCEVRAGLAAVQKSLEEAAQEEGYAQRWLVEVAACESEDAPELPLAFTGSTYDRYSLK